MRTEYKHNPPIPYSLHDMRVKKIIIQDKTIALEFEDGYVKLTEPFEQVEGNITIEGVDFDCTCVMLQSKWGNNGKFNGEKLELYSGSVVKTNFYAIYNESGECMFFS